MAKEEFHFDSFILTLPYPDLCNIQLILIDTIICLYEMAK